MLTAKTVLKIVLIPTAMAIAFSVFPIPEGVGTIILIIYAIYMYETVRNKIVISDYGPKLPDDAEGEPQQDQVNNGESHDGRK